METQKITPCNPVKDTQDTSENNNQTIDVLGDGISSVQLIRASGSDIDVVNAARVSYGSFTTEMRDRDVKLIRFLMQHNHTSPFEHNQLSFRIKCPLYVARQWMRHRMNSYNEISYRYVEAPLEYYVPTNWRFQDATNRQCSSGQFTDEQLKEKYRQTFAQCHKMYEELLENGVSRELARGILPVCTYTEFIFTCNLHSLTHFLKLRLGKGAQSEIQQYAKGMLKLALTSFPASLGAWKEFNMPELDLDQF
jgi:thymidylate synthase (FAD)